MDLESIPADDRQQLRDLASAIDDAKPEHRAALVRAYVEKAWRIQERLDSR